MVSVKYENVAIAYDNFVAVKNINLEIPDGEITTLLGPSGCGKTTLLRALAGFVDPFNGSIYIGDKNVTILPPQKRNTAMIFQNYALWPHMTIFENVEYGLKLRLKEKIVFKLKIDENEIINSASFLSYGSTKELEEIAQYISQQIVKQSTKDAWQLDSAAIFEKLAENNVKLRSVKYVCGRLKKEIRDYYTFIAKDQPSWLDQKKTKDEKINYIKPLYLYFFWITRPFFVFHPKTYYYLAKRIENEKQEYFANHKSIIAKWWWPLVKGWRYVKYLYPESKKAYLDMKEKLDSDYRFRRRKVLEVLNLVHLADQADKNPPALSGGQQQRIALARAIVVEPDVLLCDEPLSNLDAKLRKELRTEIRSIIKRIGMTAVYVTHDQTEALAISDKIAVMNVGRIEQYGSPKDVFNDPRTLYVAQFIGESTTLEGEFKGENTVKLAGGEEIKIQVKEKIDKGTKLSLVVRPENVNINNNNGFSIECKIHTIEYLGKEAKITGELKDGTILLADIVENLDQIINKKVGDNITFYIKPEDIFVFKDNKRIY